MWKASALVFQDHAARRPALHQLWKPSSGDSPFLHDGAVRLPDAQLRLSAAEIDGNMVHG
jgi:hypothetical protein